jgi:hypothetical protein
MVMYVSADDLYEQVVAWQKKKAELIAIGLTYRHIYENMKLDALVRDSDSWKVIARSKHDK